MEKYYEHSGRSPIAGYGTAIALGVGVSIFLGFIYNFLIVTIPFIYINVIITAGYGGVLGYCIKYFIRIGKIRNERQNIALAAIIGFTGFYFQWIAHMVFLDSGEHSFQAYSNNADLFYNPLLMIQLIAELNRIGSWEIFGILFTGFPLWFIWGIEALMIIGIPVIISLKHPIVPFSEKLNKWYPKHELKNQFEHIATRNQFKKDIVSETEKTIAELTYGEAYRFGRISIFYLENEEKQYLSVDNIFIEKRGKGKAKSTPIVTLLEISKPVAASLIQKYGAKKLSVLDY